MSLLLLQLKVHRRRVLAQVPLLSAQDFQRPSLDTLHSFTSLAEPQLTSAQIPITSPQEMACHLR